MNSAPATDKPFFLTRGVVLIPEDLSLGDWPERAKPAGLTTIALHHQNAPSVIVNLVRSDPGQRFLQRCRDLGLEVEYELHAIKELLPRGLFEKDPVLFRMNEQGQRTPDFNLCPHSATALDTVAENAARLAGALRPTTGRYFLWSDDGRPWCRCPQCRGLSESDQALMVENRLIDALRRVDPRAQVAHLAYHSTLPPPTQVKPKPGIFLEYAPIRRHYDVPLSDVNDAVQRSHLEALDANLALFDPSTAQALEYWIDASMHSRWKRPFGRLPFVARLMAADSAAYAQRGIRHVTSFACGLDADYLSRFGEPPVAVYGATLLKCNR